MKIKGMSLGAKSSDIGLQRREKRRIMLKLR